MSLQISKMSLQNTLNFNDEFDNLFDQIDTEEKAYLFGILTNNKTKFIEKFNSAFVNFTDELKWVFLRGYFEEHGTICDPEDNVNPECNITTDSNDVINDISKFVKIPNTINNNTITFVGTNCIDFLGHLYPSSAQYKSSITYDKYITWLMWNPCISGMFGMNISKDLPECLVYKTDTNAIIPSKSKESDAGYDLTVIKVAKKFLQNITLYDTGIKIRVGHGLYAEVVPRSSLSKSGYMLANSIGIIDRSYNGNIFIALIKVDPEAPDIELPFKCCQMIFRQQVHVNITEVNSSFEDTARGEGGFGSTGK